MDLIRGRNAVWLCVCIVLSFGFLARHLLSWGLRGVGLV